MSHLVSASLPWVSGMLGLWADGSQASCVSLADIMSACPSCLSPHFLIVSFEINVRSDGCTLPLRVSIWLFICLRLFLLPLNSNV